MTVCTSYRVTDFIGCATHFSTVFLGLQCIWATGDQVMNGLDEAESDAVVELAVATSLLRSDSLKAAGISTGSWSTVAAGHLKSGETPPS